MLGLGGLGDRLAAETAVRRNQALNRSEVFVDVAGDLEHAPRLERAFDLREQARGEDPTFLVPLLPPWIGEIDVDRPEASGRDQAMHHDPGITAPDLGIGQLAASQPLGGELGIFPRELDTQVIVAWHGCGGAREEQSLARSNLELDRVLIAEEDRPLDRGDVVFEGGIDEVGRDVDGRILRKDEG
jgi:hypothetical protein